MKEYICVDDTYKSLDKDERKVFLKLISKSMRYTIVDICREFFEELRTRMYQGRDTSYQGMCDKGYELLAEMEQVSVEEYDTREYAKQNPKWVEKIKRLAEMEQGEIK